MLKKVALCATWFQICNPIHSHLMTRDNSKYFGA